MEETGNGWIIYHPEMQKNMLYLKREKGETEDSMRIYQDENSLKLQEVYCNKCGRKIKVENGIVKEGCFCGDTIFGYFSKKDGIRHKFDLCEECYDAVIKEFSIPVFEVEEKELC